MLQLPLAADPVVSTDGRQGLRAEPMSRRAALLPKRLFPHAGPTLVPTGPSCSYMPGESPEEKAAHGGSAPVRWLKVRLVSLF